MNDITPPTSTSHTAAAQIHDLYVAQINHLVSLGREALIPDLTAEYETAMRSVDALQHAA